MALQSVVLKCTGCGAKLDVTSEMDRFACGYCGEEQIVKRQGGTIFLKPVVEAIGKVQNAAEKTAAELALKRLSGDLAALRLKREEIQSGRDLELVKAIAPQSRKFEKIFVGSALLMPVVFGVAFEFFSLTAAVGACAGWVILVFALVGALRPTIAEQKRSRLSEIDAELASVERQIKTARDTVKS